MKYISLSEENVVITAKVGSLAVVALAMLSLLFFASIARADEGSGHGYGQGTSTGGSYSSFSASAQLNGQNEVPPVSTNMTGSFSFANDNSFTLNVYNGDDVKAAHLHCAAAGVNGPVVVNLYENASSTDVNGPLSAGTIQDAHIYPDGANCPTPIRNLNDLKKAMANGSVYVNVHTVEYLNGEIRGQVSGSGTWNPGSGNNNGGNNNGSGYGDGDGHGNHDGNYGHGDDESCGDDHGHDGYGGKHSYGDHKKGNYGWDDYDKNHKNDYDNHDYDWNKGHDDKDGKGGYGGGYGWNSDDNNNHSYDWNNGYDRKDYDWNKDWSKNDRKNDYDNHDKGGYGEYDSKDSNGYGGYSQGYDLGSQIRTHINSSVSGLKATVGVSLRL